MHWSDWTFIPGAGWLMAVYSLLTTLFLLGIGFLIHRFRVIGGKLARKRAAIDYPDDIVEGCHCFKLDRYRYVELRLKKTGIVVYQLAIKEEAAFKVDDPRK